MISESEGSLRFASAATDAPPAPAPTITTCFPIADSFFISPPRRSAPGSINPAAGGDHQEAEQLAHAEGSQNEAELRIRLPEELDTETDSAVTDQIEGKEGAVEGTFTTNQPQDGKQDDSLEESFVELGGMAQQTQRVVRKDHPPGTVVARP